MKLLSAFFFLVFVHASIVLPCDAFAATTTSPMRHSTRHPVDLTKGITKLDSPFLHSRPNPASLSRQRKSVARIQTMGLFGLGGAEIAIILVAVAIIVGPQQLGNMAGNVVGKAKGEYDGLPEDLKKIPAEFQKGFEEGSENAKARNAKPMEAIPSGEADGDGSQK
jgi:Sec-independent protein translocase protein TatA